MLKAVTIILAAGTASRMGKAKQLLRFDGRSLLQRSIETAMAAGLPVVVILGAYSKATRKESSKYPVKTVVNDQFEQGISTSINTGVAAAKKLVPSLQGVLITLVDQPYIPLEHLRLILDTAAADESIIATAYQGTVGVPAYFPALYLDDLAKLRGDSGAKSLIKKKMDQLIKIPYHDASIDIDTEKDWLEFLQERQGR